MGRDTLIAGRPQRCSLSPADVPVPAIVPDHVLALIGDRGGESGYPIQDGEHFNVSLEDRVRLGVIEDSFAIWMIPQLLPGEGGAEDILGSRAPPGLVLATDPPLVIDADPECGHLKSCA